MRENRGFADEYWLYRVSLSDVFIKALGSPASVLDVGCAGGRVLKHLSQSGCECYGIDLDAGLLAKVRSLYPAWTLRPGDYNNPLAWEFGRRFDLVASNVSIRKDYCRDLTGFAQNCHRVADRIAFKIQGPNDLQTFMCKQARADTYFGEEEIREAFVGYNLTIQPETYFQRFSSQSYLRKMLERINLVSKYPEDCKQLNIWRQFLIVEGTLS